MSPVSSTRPDTVTIWLRRIIVGLAILIVIVGTSVLRPREERRVRARVQALAETLSTPVQEADVQRLARMAKVRSFFTEDATVYFDKDERQPIQGRDQIVAIAATAFSQFGPVQVEARDLRVTLRQDAGGVADVHLEGRLVSRDPKSDPPNALLDARAVSVTLRKVEGNWRVTSARIMASDDAER